MSMVQKILYDAIDRIGATGQTPLSWEDLVEDRRVNLLVDEFKFIMGETTESRIEEACDVLMNVERHLTNKPDRDDEDIALIRQCQIILGKLRHPKTRDGWTEFLPGIMFPTTLHVFLSKDTANRIYQRAEREMKSLGAYIESIFQGHEDILRVDQKVMRDLEWFAHKHKTTVGKILKVTLKFIKKNQKYENA